MTTIAPTQRSTVYQAPWRIYAWCDVDCGGCGQPVRFVTVTEHGTEAWPCRCTWNHGRRT